MNDDRAQNIAVLLGDCERLIVGYFPAISGSALQLYHLILLLIPRKTALARNYAGECRAENSVKVFGGVTGSWDACLGTVTAHEGQWVSAVDFSPDGRTIVSSGGDKKIRFWDALTCTPLLVLSGHSKEVHSVKYSPDGARVVSTTDDGTVKIWDAISGVLLCTLEGHRNRVLCAVFTPDGRRIVSGSRDHSIKIWDAETGACVTTLTEHRDQVRSIAVSSDGLWMASGADDMVCLWSLEAPYTCRILLKRERWDLTYSVTFTPDSSTVLAAPQYASSGQLSIWDVKTAEHLRNLQLPGQPFLSTRSPNFPSARDKFACGSGNSVLILDLASGEARQTFSRHTNDVTCVAYSQDGTRIVSGSRDGTVRLWDATQNAVNTPRLEDAIKSFDPPSEESADCRSTVFSHNRSHVLLARDNDSIGPLSLLSKHRHYAAFSPDDATILTASEGDRGGVALWDAASGALRAQWESELHVAWWSPSFQGTFMWSGVLGYVPHCFGGQSSRIMFSSDSRISGVGNIGPHSACLWDAATGKLIREFVGHSGVIFSVGFSLDGRRIATGSRDKTVIIWEVATGARVATCRGHNDWVRSVAFSPNGEHVTSGGDDRRVIVWNAEGGELLQSFEGHTLWVTSVAFSPGGDVVISSDYNADMRLWDIATGACLLILNMATWGSTVRLSPDGSGVLVDDDKRVVQLWAPLNEDAPATTSRSWLPRRTWPIYYEEDGWIFSLTPTRRTRLCWVPVDWQGIAGFLGQDVLFGKQGARLNFSALSSYLESLHTDST
ncbi:uncharacterized protein PHACADRAFT_248499 [Phanerochaete carnosa HHB-10118-sp]|uniref:Uncharacterized protein n=1 Tax=Phanerochaete carnosa (strain HHB-10118-sp) TaxID=650164 RepID=K5XF57_PHACS|nr:uncharacterized protein PHACADRAFT_248499 [Phanerochaete carnosa HHB-10118-sp]EKM61722.1 hypothetical protein PHACADRAFT_248499 [Phanerochaete carnosa HHB-10118-sp]